MLTRDRDEGAVSRQRRHVPRTMNDPPDGCGLLEQGHERSAGISIVMKTQPFDGQQDRPSEVVMHSVDGLSGESTRIGNRGLMVSARCFVVGAGALHDRNARGRDRDDDEDDQRAGRGADQAASAVVLADVLALEIVLGHAMCGRRELRDCVAETTVAQIQIVGIVRPPQIEMARLVGERAPQR